MTAADSSLAITQTNKNEPDKALVTRFAFREVALTPSEHGTQHFPADHPVLLAEGDAPFGQLVSQMSMRRQERTGGVTVLRYSTGNGVWLPRHAGSGRVGDHSTPTTIHDPSTTG